MHERQIEMAVRVEAVIAAHEVPHLCLDMVCARLPMLPQNATYKARWYGEWRNIIIEAVPVEQTEASR